MFDLDAHSNSYLVCVLMTQRSHFSHMRQQSMQFKKYGVVLNMGSRNRMFLSCMNSEKLLNLPAHRRDGSWFLLEGCHENYMKAQQVYEKEGENDSLCQ